MSSGLWVTLVGECTVVRDGRPQPPAVVGSRKGRRLLALLAVKRDSWVPVDRIVDTLWTDAVPSRPAEGVATLVSRLRARLGATSILGGRSGYRLGHEVGVDLHGTAQLVRSTEAALAHGDPRHALRDATCALRLLRRADALANEPDADWVRSARMLHAELLRRALHGTAAAALDVADFATARTVAAEAWTIDPFDELACQWLMRAHHAAGEPARALLAYERLRTLLVAELGTYPNGETRAVRRTVLRDQRVVHVARTT